MTQDVQPATVTANAGTNLNTSALATVAKQPALGTAGSASADVITVQGVASMVAVKVDGSAVTQPVSAASLPLPSGASTAAKQPALGTAGTPSTDVISVQGVTAGIPLASSLKTVQVVSTPTLDTSAYATGDNLFGTAMVDLGAVVRANGGTGIITGLSVLDISNPSGILNPSSLDVLLFDTTGTIQAANAAAAYSDAVMAKCVDLIQVATYSLTTVNSFAKRDLWKTFKCASADTHLYMAVIVRGTPTYGVSDLTFTFSIAQD